MIKKKNRLKKKEFNLVFKEGVKKRTKFFLFVRKDKKNEKKISVSVSKKVEKKAVFRNKTKRMVFEILRQNFEKIPENVNLVLIVSSPILNKDKKEVQKDILNYFESKK